MRSSADVDWRATGRRERVRPLVRGSTTPRAPAPSVGSRAVHLDAPTCRALLRELGPSLGLWRAAEVAVLREVTYEPPVLDLGCGDGAAVSRVLSRVAFGVDPDTRTLERAARRGIYEQLLPVRVEALPMRAASMSTVVSNSVLEHIPRVDAVFHAVHRMLRPRGRFVFTTPTEAFSDALTFPLGPYARWRNRQYGHVNLWPLRRWRAHLERAGLELEYTRTYLRPSLVRMWDALDLTQQLRMGRAGIVSAAWHRLPDAWLGRLAERVARWDLSAAHDGGGRLIVARKR
ncbi:MAG TPA: class I SAM-dependent methyltransferase [Gemmatimonadaceae bacterium]|nr:class I SAM-dependent methyltransferase [Gemmatimonadaceae bacterium]